MLERQADYNKALKRWPPLYKVSRALDSKAFQSILRHYDKFICSNCQV